ncbi:hypothetical protein DN051_42190 (plasmid) [Streptomyces cadmiisoli]|uniref:Uncharacterized protein n=1 Tax=Streptomyces cadmiisoli TaxID=2184053 RepID=A0A2Z4JF49_9ACTN|nr:hypothetical protein DN051_42190 [Streptomyces cadmiisoli]
MRSAFRAWDLTADDAELIANPVQHAHDDVVWLAVRRLDEQAVQMAVIDRCHAGNVRRPMGLLAVSDRGLASVDHFATRWGVDLWPCGKRVCADLAVTRAM